MRYLIADTETTGFSKSDGIVELAFIEVDDMLNRICEYESIIDPECQISPGASKVHRLYAEDVIGAPTMKEACKEACGDFSEPICLIAHNSKFDRRFLEPDWNIKAEIDTLKLARQLYPKAPNHKLGTLVDHLGITRPDGGNEHAAMYDVLLLYGLLARLMREAGAITLKDLLNQGKQLFIYTRMPWGKHKGKLLTDLPGGYVSWLLGLPDLDEGLKASLRAIPQLIE